MTQTKELTPTPRDREHFTKGARVIVAQLNDYKLVQNRPMDCRCGCRCGECNGYTTLLEGTVERVNTYSEDFNIVTEATVDLDEGRAKIVRIDR